MTALVADTRPTVQEPGAVAVAVVRLAHHDPALALPGYATGGAAGLDVSACLPAAERAAGRLVAAGDRTLVPTGLAIAIPEGYEVQMRPRSGLALKQGLTLLNSPGTIDADYRGEVGIILINHGAEPVVISHGMRVAQMVLAPVTRLAWMPASVLPESGRGGGGFGSTGTA